MDDQIINRVSNSPLLTIDLEEFRPEGIRLFFDLKQILEDNLIVRENKIRQFIKEHDWHQYSNKFVAVGCSSEAILPFWANLLIVNALNPYVKKVIIGNMAELEIVLFEKVLNELDFSKYQDKPVIIKGCSDSSIPHSAYSFLINKLQGIAKKISYGEACSSVPIWKSSNN